MMLHAGAFILHFSSLKTSGHGLPLSMNNCHACTSSGDPASKSTVIQDIILEGSLEEGSTMGSLLGLGIMNSLRIR